jgi:hypothetical protein
MASSSSSSGRLSLHGERPPQRTSDSTRFFNSRVRPFTFPFGPDRCARPEPPLATAPRAPHPHPAIVSPPAVHGVHVRPSGASPSPAPPSTTTVVAAVGAQARVVPRVRVAQSLDAINAPGPVPVVYFDNVPDGAALSLTAISLGAGAYSFLSCAPKKTPRMF